MIKVSNLKKEFVTYEKGKGLKGAIKGIIKRKKKIITAVEGISFDINEGDIVGYIGANGAGKSTTIKMLTGILTPTSGKCEVNGIVPYENRIKNAKNIGVVFGQRTQLWWDLPLIESFSVLKDIYQVDKKEFDERMEFMDRVLSINEFIKKPVRTLSLGQRMRADFAASFLHNPKIVYLDEPTIGLDVVVKENIRNAIKEMNKKYNTTIILTTHDMSDIEELCNRIIIIDKGKKLYDGDIETIKDKFGSRRIIEFEAHDYKQGLEKVLKNSFEDKIDLEVEKNKITVKYDRKEITINEIMPEILVNFNIADIKISETSVEEIVRWIYQNGI